MAQQRLSDREFHWLGFKLTPMYSRGLLPSHNDKIKKLSIVRLIALGVTGAFVLNNPGALAQSQIVPDGTLGTKRSIVIPNFQGLPVEAIQGGAIRGPNLFHSFQEFNVSAGLSFPPACLLQPSQAQTGMGEI